MAFKYDRYTDEELDPNNVEKFTVVEDGVEKVQFPIRYSMQKPLGPDGQPRDQTGDAARNMRYAHSLGLPELTQRPPRMGRAIIVAGGPSVKGELEKIRYLASLPDSYVFAINWTHTWLINNGIIPNGCVFFEIDAEPDSVLEAAHPACTYFICSHCDQKTFDSLAGYKRVLWHSPPNSEAERAVSQELYAQVPCFVGGGVGTFTRTMSLALFMGFRNIELFGVDSSFPEDATSTHVEGYETANDIRTDLLVVHAKHNVSGVVRKFHTVGYLALQHDEFQEYCRINHHVFALRAHGDGLLQFMHRACYPTMYDDAAGPIPDTAGR